MSSKLGTLAVNKLLTYVENNSLPECYKGVQDWLFDFYPDLSWDDEDFIMDVQAVINHPEFGKVQGWFLTKHHFNLLDELQEGLLEAL